MDRLTKLKKSELIKQVKAFGNDRENARSGWTAAQNQLERTKKSFEDEKKKSQGLDNQLSDIRKAIETVRRMKYPHNFMCSSDGYESDKPTEQVAVNEELNLLNYLQDLAQAEMNTENLSRRY